MTGSDADALQARGRSFGAVAAGYAALRPTYPAEAVAFLLGDGGPRRVLDLGAGTGLLTEVVRGMGHEVRAVDPSPEMLAELTARLPRVGAAVGTAEAIPVADASVDGLVAGQAAHWFDPAPAAREMGRVLRPGGVLGLIWNTRDARVQWVAALEALLVDEARGHEADQASSTPSRASWTPTSRRPRRGSSSAWRPRRSSEASPPAATSRSWTRSAARSSSPRCDGCWPSTPTPGDARRSSCPT